MSLFATFSFLYSCLFFIKIIYSWFLSTFPRRMISPVASTFTCRTCRAFFKIFFAETVQASEKYVWILEPPTYSTPVWAVSTVIVLRIFHLCFTLADPAVQQTLLHPVEFVRVCTTNGLKVNYVCLTFPFYPKHTPHWDDYHPHYTSSRGGRIKSANVAPVCTGKHVRQVGQRFVGPSVGLGLGLMRVDDLWMGV